VVRCGIAGQVGKVLWLGTELIRYATGGVATGARPFSCALNEKKQRKETYRDVLQVKLVGTAAWVDRWGAPCTQCGCSGDKGVI
jgi:hypothetical protein